MKITTNTVTLFHYDLFEMDSNNKIETSRKGDAVAFLYGHNNVIKGLEEAMTDHEAGDHFSVEIPAHKAYGMQQKGREQRVPIKHLLMAKKTRLRPGTVVAIQTDKGQRQATVIKAGKFTVDVDMNHPLAGKDLRFDIDVVNVRAATDEEIAHGHAHGLGGHHH